MADQMTLPGGPEAPYVSTPEKIDRKNAANPKVAARLATLGFRKMEHVRKNRLRLLKQYCGRFWGAEKVPRAMPLNMMYSAVTTIVPNLAFRQPGVRISSRFLAYREYAEVGELAMDHLLKEIDLRGTLRRVIADAVFSAGFTKTGIATSGQAVDVDGFLHDAGQPYCDHVSVDDMVLDPQAKHWEEQRIIGNRFTIDCDALKESGLYDPDEIDKLASRWEDDSGSAGLGYGNLDPNVANDPLRQVDLVELWIPDEQVIMVLPWGPGNEIDPKPLRVVDYEGPESGPYHMLGFAFVPDNILPVAPAGIWYDLIEAANKSVRQAARQSERQKSILAYEASAWQDAQQIVDAADGEAVKVERIDAVKEVSFGGVADDQYRFISWAKMQFSELAMSMDMLSGSGSDESTATQAEILNANTTVRLEDMQGLVADLAQGVAENLWFFLHTDPLIELPLVKRTRGIDSQVAYTPEMREGDWSDYNLKIRPYSMARQDPNVRIRRLMEFLANVIPATAQAYQMMGPAFNLENALRIAGREMDIEELDELINSDVLSSMADRMRQMLEMGIPVDPKTMSTMLMGQTGAGSILPAAGGAGVRPGQPNPSAMGPAGMTPTQETNAARQETAGELQSTYTAGG